MAHDRAIKKRKVTATAGKMSSNEVLPLLNAILARLSVIEDKIGVETTGGDASVADVPKLIKAFDAYCAECLDPFVAVCEKLGAAADSPDIVEIGNNIKGAWVELRAFLLMASACKEPAKMDGSILSGLATKIKAAGAVIKRNEWEKHAKACSEGIACLNW
jgi:hypothetical protein